MTRARKLWLTVGTASLLLAVVDAVTNAVSNHEGLVWVIVTPLAGLTFVAADNDLVAAAQLEGLATDNPNLHP
jgi:hypothetical protein